MSAAAIPPKVTVVMYHYVRPLADSAFPKLKALELDAFLAQLDYLSTHYTVISPKAFSAALHDGARLPENPCLLTFDDGYSDHYRHAFPAMQARGMTGLFFAPHMSLVDRQMLEVNQVQFVLANAKDPDALAAELDTLLQARGVQDIATLRQEFGAPNRYDTAEVSYFKKLLQHALPPDLRSAIIAQLFETHVTADTVGFAEELYLTTDQAKEMRAAGNEFGGHGRLHLWHAKSEPAQLLEEVQGSVAALKAIGAPVRDGFYCYPFGSEDHTVRAAVQSAGFTTAFTVAPRLAQLGEDDQLAIPRLDTNDLPQTRNATENKWLAEAVR